MDMTIIYGTSMFTAIILALVLVILSDAGADWSPVATSA